jgi:Ca2+-binding RTX toxin-like protein
VSYSLTDDAGGRFQINATTGVVSVLDPSLLDYETETSHTVTVQATSSDGSTSESAFTINLTDDTGEFAVTAATDADVSANEISESAAVGAAVGVTALSGDLDGTDTVSYSLEDDAGGRFQINATTGVVSVLDPDGLDYETATSHDVVVRATSSDGTYEDSTFTINVLDNQTPVFGADRDTIVVENTDAATVVHTAQATDADGDTLSYSLGGTDAAAFTIDSESGEVRFISSPDYEAQSSYDFTVTAFDGFLSAVQNVSVDIFNVDELVELGSDDLASGGAFAGEGLDDTMDGSASTASLDLSGGGGNDIMTGGSADDVLDGGAGNDELNGGAGDDVIITGGGLDRVDGGDGIDTVVLQSDEGDIVSVNLSRQWQYSGDGWNYIANVENVTTGAGEDIIQGNDIANVLDSGSGDDWLYAGGGDDVLIGGAGTDRLFGGDGNDTVVFKSGDDLTVNLNSEWQVGNLNTSEGMDKIIGVENVTTGAGDDTLIGNADANILTGGDGDDTLTGGDGDDVFRFYASEGMSTDVITDFVVGEDKIELVNDTTDVIGSAVITTDANGSTVTWDELTIVLDVVITQDDINPIV